MRARQMMPPFTASSANRTYFGFPRTTTCANIYKRWLLGSYTGAPVTPMFGSRSRHDLSARNGDVTRSYGVPTEVCPLSAWRGASSCRGPWWSPGAPPTVWVGWTAGGAPPPCPPTAGGTRGQTLGPPDGHFAVSFGAPPGRFFFTGPVASSAWAAPA